jgi:hypothetical protein
MHSRLDERGSVVLTIPYGQAVVLHEWIRRNKATDLRLDQLGIVDASERLLLWNLLASLEKVCPAPRSLGTNNSLSKLGPISGREPKRQSWSSS